MKLTRKLLLTGASLGLMAGTVALVGTGVAAAKGKAPSPGSVTCTTVSGVLKFSTPLTTNGPSTGSETTTFAGKLGSCTATGTGSKSPKSGKVSESTTTNNGSSCSGFSSGVIKNATTFTIKWAPGSISPTTITFPAGDISVASNGEGFTLGGAKGTVTGSGSYPGSDNFAGSKAQASTAPLNLTNGLCAGGKPQKTIKIVSGTDTVG